MSRIDELIAEYCPGGVPFKALGDIAETVPGLTGKTKADFSNGNARYVSYKNAFANLAVDQLAGDFVALGENERQNRLRLGDVVITGSSESLDEVGLSSVVVTEPKEPLYLNSFCFALRFSDPSLLAPEFTKYLMRADSVRTQIRRSASGVTRINISKPRFMKVRIPVPPLEVQREIVRVLDTFTSLEAELEAELEARRQQYEYYKSALLAVPKETPTEPLGKHCRVFGGAPFASEHFNDNGQGLPVVRIRDINTGFSGTYYSGTYDAKYLVKNGDLLVGMDGDFNIVRWCHGDAVLNQRVSRLQEFDDSVDPAFTFHLVRQAISRIQASTQASTVKHLSSKQIAAIPVPMIPLEEQCRRSKVLNSFDSLVNSLSIGLPAELAARRKQYEYYRDRLLTFEEASA